jgi:hypothetical protein
MSLKIEESTSEINLDGTITVRIPINIRRKSGRRFIMTPGDTELEYVAPKRSDPMIGAIVKAHLWKEELESGKIANQEAIAKRERITASYISRIYRLTLLAPDIIDAILAGTQPKTLALLDLLKPFPLLWEEQRDCFGFSFSKADVF